MLMCFRCFPRATVISVFAWVFVFSFVARATVVACFVCVVFFYTVLYICSATPSVVTTNADFESNTTTKPHMLEPAFSDNKRK